MNTFTWKSIWRIRHTDEMRSILEVVLNSYNIFTKEILKMETTISMESLETFEKNFDANRANSLAMNAVTANGVNASAKNYETERKTTFDFSISLEQGKITNQKKSGRCWMFAALNCLRFQVIRKRNLENFELSQNYTLFYDKLEKSNYFLECILKTLDEPTEGRLIAHLLSMPLNDGGQWDMLTAIVSK